MSSVFSVVNFLISACRTSTHSWAKPGSLMATLLSTRRMSRRRCVVRLPNRAIVMSAEENGSPGAPRSDRPRRGKRHRYRPRRLIDFFGQQAAQARVVARVRPHHDMVGGHVHELAPAPLRRNRFAGRERQHVQPARSQHKRYARLPRQIQQHQTQRRRASDEFIRQPGQRHIQHARNGSDVNGFSHPLGIRIGNIQQSDFIARPLPAVPAPVPQSPAYAAKRIPQCAALPPRSSAPACVPSISASVCHSGNTANPLIRHNSFLYQS